MHGELVAHSWHEGEQVEVRARMVQQEDRSLRRGEGHWEEAATREQTSVAVCFLYLRYAQIYRDRMEAHVWKQRAERVGWQTKLAYERGERVMQGRQESAGPMAVTRRVPGTVQPWLRPTQNNYD